MNEAVFPVQGLRLEATLFKLEIRAIRSVLQEMHGVLASARPAAPAGEVTSLLAKQVATSQKVVTVLGEIRDRICSCAERNVGRPAGPSPRAPTTTGRGRSRGQSAAESATEPKASATPLPQITPKVYPVRTRMEKLQVRVSEAWNRVPSGVGVRDVIDAILLLPVAARTGSRWAREDTIDNINEARNRIEQLIGAAPQMDTESLARLQQFVGAQREEFRHKAAQASASAERLKNRRSEVGTGRGSARGFERNAHYYRLIYESYDRLHQKIREELGLRIPTELPGLSVTPASHRSFREIFSGAFEKIKSVVTGVVGALGKLPILRNIPDVARAIGGAVQNPRGTLTGTWKSLKEGTSRTWGGLGDTAGQNLASLGHGFQYLLSDLHPLGMVATLLQGVFQGLAPLMDALKEPLRMVGEIFGKALAPILKALFPVFKLVAIAATWVGEIFFRVAAGITTAVGWLIQALGKAVDSLLPGKQDGLTKVGQSIMDMGKGFNEGANALREGREQLKELEFGETAEAAKDTAENLRNIPEGFKVALARFQVAAPTPVTAGGIGTVSTPVSGGTPGTVVEHAPVTIERVEIVSSDPEAVWRGLKDVIARENTRNYGSPYAPAYV